MSKPIFIMRFPYNIVMSEEHFLKNYEAISKRLDDYHVLAMKDSFVQEVTFECFNAPHTEMEFQELKKRVLDILNLTYEDKDSRKPTSH